jgi:peptidoglycan/LPS O-acetylase OafA/YrhL
MPTVRKIPPFLMLDAWRGIAALWVVMGHACAAFLATGDNGRFIHFPLYAFSIRAQLGVVIFFVISGYCIMGAAYGAVASGRSAMGYGFDRLRRIYPPYLAATVLAVSLTFLIGLAQSHHLLPRVNHALDLSLLREPKFWLANLLLIQSECNQPAVLLVAWSLCYEIVFYALLGVLLVLARIFPRRSPGAMVVTVFQIGIAGLTFSSLAWLIVSPGTCPFPLDRWYQFGLGALLFLVFAEKPGSPAWGARGQLVGAGILLLLFAILHADHFAFGQPSTRQQAATCLIFVAILWALRPFDASFAHRPVLRPLMWLGTISYSVYLIHPVVIAYPDAGGRRLGFDHEWYWVTYLVEIAVSIVAGWLFFLLVERHFISSRQKQRIESELSK